MRKIGHNPDQKGTIMKEKYYEEIFEVTETLQNGNERRKRVSVYSPIFINGRHVIELNRITKAIEALKAEHYYNIEHVETRTKTMIFTR